MTTIVTANTRTTNKSMSSLSKASVAACAALTIAGLVSLFLRRMHKHSLAAGTPSAPAASVPAAQRDSTGTVQSRSAAMAMSTPITAAPSASGAMPSAFVRESIAPFVTHKQQSKRRSRAARRPGEEDDW